MALRRARCAVRPPSTLHRSWSLEPRDHQVVLRGPFKFMQNQAPVYFLCKIYSVCIGKLYYFSIQYMRGVNSESVARGTLRIDLAVMILRS